MKKIISIALCFLMVFMLCPSAVFAASTITWTGSADDGSWYTAGNWDLNQVPVDNDYVLIPESSVVDYTYGETSVMLNCAGNLTVSGGALKLASGNSSLTNGKLDGAGDITITEGGNFLWSGGSIEGLGRLIIENKANLYANASSSLDRYLVNSGSLLITDSLRLTGGAEGDGNFNIQEGQILELGGSGTYDLSSSNVSNMGTLRILNTCTSVQFNSTYTQQNTGTLEFDIGGLDDFTKLEVAGNASLNGELKINILDGYSPQSGDTFEIMTYGSRTGEFTSIVSNMPEITFEPTYTDTGLTLIVNDGTASGGYLCKVGEVGYDTLDGALEAVMYGGTIQLLGNIDYDGGLVIDGADITFDLNGYTLNVNSSTYSVPGVGLEVKNGGNVYLIGSGQFNVRQISNGTCYGVKVSEGSTAMVTNVQVTLTDNGSAFGAYADGTGSSIHVLGNVHVMGVGGCGAKTLGRGRITVDGTIAAMAYINIGSTYKDISSGVADPEKPGYLKYCNEIVTGIVWVKATASEFAGGDGSKENPYLIETVDQLNNVRNYLGTEHSDKHFKLIANLDLDIAPYNSGSGWEPIGISESPFTGSFDGDDHIISNLFIDRFGDPKIGLFGYTGETAKIWDLKLTNVNVRGNHDVGGLVGWNEGEIANSSVTGDVTGRGETGGLVGVNHGSITDSWTIGTVTDVWGGSVGGLVAENFGPIDQCHAEATVTSGSSNVGGLVGANYDSITESYAVGAAEGSSYVGGLVGLNSEGIIDRCYATGDVTGTEDGINYTFAGGLVGLNRASISDSYARGAVSGQEDIGGLVGCNSSSGTITNSYSTGAVSGDSYIGGLVGFNYSEGIITDSYWDMDTSHQESSDGGTGKRTAEMKQQETYVGWDFTATWAISASENDGYPFLAVPAAPTVPTEPQNFTAAPGDGQVTLSWTAPASDGGSEITYYEVFSDNIGKWVTASTSNSHTFTGLTNDTEYIFKVRAVNSVGPGAEASVTATPTAPAQTTHTVKFYSDGSLYTSKTVIGGSALGANWPTNPTKSGYNFGGWFTGQNGAGTQYTNTTIITADVDLHAKWTYSGSSGSVGGDSRGNTPSTPIYKADVRKENGADTTLPVKVNEDDGTASIDVGSQNFTQGETVIIIPSVPGVDTYFTGIPVPNLSTTDVQGTLTLNTNLGSITVPSNMLTGVAGADGNKARIAIGQGDKSTLPKDIRTTVGNRPLIQLTLYIDGKQIAWNNPQTPVTVAIPYTPTSEELTRPEHITVWHIDGNGRIDSMDGKYDPLSGTVIFTTTHFNYYAVVYESVARLAGTDRVETGLKIAQAAYPDKISHAVLATANNYPDALAGSVLAYQLDSPLLLVGTSKKDQEKVLSYLKAKLKPEGTVYILGGTGAISQSFAEKVSTATSAKINRIVGKDRYETSVKIAEQLNVKTGTAVVLASGENYPDALAISSIAAQNQLPILLVQKGGLSAAVSEELSKIRPNKIYIIGLEGAISSNVASQAAKLTGLPAENIIRIGGADRYATSLTIAQYFNLGSDTLCLATGKNYPDSLAGSVYAGLNTRLRLS